MTGKGSEEAYYVDGKIGNDNNPGTKNKPIKTISELNFRLHNKPLSVCFTGEQVYNGSLVIRDVEGTESGPVIVTSSGDVKAVINGENNEAIHIENCRYVTIEDLDLRGNGRKGGNMTNGLSIIGSSCCDVRHISASGFQKSGVDLYNCNNCKLSGILASDNGFSGINVLGSTKELSSRIIISDCRAENNPGDPTNLENHSGNGILVGVSDSIIIDHCSATNNGWDMPRKGNGPVGIWTWESNRVVIQYCISYRNKTSEKASDGGGFDLDGGVTNSVIQYCLSYENQGAGYGLFQYRGASAWANNIVRYCVSINDATTTKDAGSIFIWNGSGKSDQLNNCLVHNNVFYNSFSPVISFEESSPHQNFRFCNNIFLGTGEVIAGNIGGSHFFGNDWWNAGKNFTLQGFDSVKEWARASHQEMLDGELVGIQVDPGLNGPLTTSVTDPWKLTNLKGFALRNDSYLRNEGIAIKYIAGFVEPVTDFYGNTIKAGTVRNPGIFYCKTE